MKHRFHVLWRGEVAGTRGRCAAAAGIPTAAAAARRKESCCARRMLMQRFCWFGGALAEIVTVYPIPIAIRASCYCLFMVSRHQLIRPQKKV